MAHVRWIATASRGFLILGVFIKRAVVWRRDVKQNRWLGIIALGALLPSAPVSADTIFGIYAGIGSWRQELTGEITSGLANINVEEDLALEDELNSVFYLAIEHPIPVLPNVRVNYAELNVSGNNSLTRAIDFNGVSFSLSEDIATEVDVSQIDLVLYYELLDNVVSLDLGVAVRWMDGSVTLASLLDYSEVDYDVVMPALYGRVRADLPFSGFWVGAEVMGLGYSGNVLIDANAQVGWESKLGLGAEIGWRMFDFEVEDLGDLDQAGIDISGPYFALNYHF